MCARNDVTIIEDLMRSLIGTCGIDVVMTGLHNAMSHGEIVECTDEELEKFYKHFDKASKVAKKMMGN